MKNPFTTDQQGGDKPSYRDDPESFGQSSDTAQGGSSSRMSGEGVEGSSPEAGTGTPKDGGSPADFDPGDRDGEEAVTSRSADPGQSSYGGFKNEGTSPQNEGHHEQASNDPSKDAGSDDAGTV